MSNALTKAQAAVRLLRQKRKLRSGVSFNPDGFRRWHIGDATVTKVIELEGAGFGDFLLPQADRTALAAVEWLDPGHVDAKGELKLSVHSFVVEIGGHRVLVDTNAGNGKRRSPFIWNNLATPWLKDLERAGFAPESIDTVLCTHLHIDHVGWNTIRRGEQWVPTFPNARYVIDRGEYNFWHDRLDDKRRAQLFADSVEPLVSAGLVDFSDPGDEPVPGVQLVATPGHTDHHVSVLISSGGQQALITGDFLHHPIQIAHPEWSSLFDTQPDTAVNTRRQWFDRLADDQILVLGTAFSDPTAGYIRRSKSGFRLEPVR